MTATQTIYLNQTEYRVPPVIHAVQNDTGRKIKMVIQDQVLPSGSTATLDFMRSDKSHYSVTCEAFVSADNSFTAEIDQALTQAGITECQLKVSGIVSTFTFIIDVQPDVSGLSVQQDGYSAEQIVEIMDSKGITEDIKQTLLACFEKVAWIDEDGQDYYDALHDALYPPRPILSLIAIYIQSGTVYAGDALDSLRSDLSVQVNYEDGGSEFVTDYYLSGTLYEGESTITVTYGGKTTTFDVQVVTLVSISAVYTQTGTVLWSDSLDSLRDDLVVTATYDDESTRAITNYTLSGTLILGQTSTITVSYGGKNTTFDVVVSDIWYILTTDDFIKAGITLTRSSTGPLPYTQSSSTRLCYPAFDLALPGGKTYLFSLTASINTAQISPSFYNQNNLDKVNGSQNLNGNDNYEPGWNDEVMERHITVQENVNDSPIKGCRISLRKDSSNGTIADNFVSTLTIREVTT